jgi:hypothetical protein
MRKIRSREVLLLTVPVMLLIGAGGYLAFRPVSLWAKTWRTVLDEATVVPITPREAYLGWDTKVTIKAHEEGIGTTPPEHTPAYPPKANLEKVHLVSVKNGVERIVDSLTGKRFTLLISGKPAPESEVWMEFRMRMADLPVNSGELRLKGSIKSSTEFIAGGRYHPISSQPAYFDVKMRNAGEKGIVPRISKFRPIRLLKTRIEKASPTDPHLNTTVHVAIEAVDGMLTPEEAKLVSWEQCYFTDAKGRRHDKFKPLRGARIGLFPGYLGIHGEKAAYYPMFEFPMAQLSKGRLTFHTSVSVNNCWPLPVEVVVREK